MILTVKRTDVLGLTMRERWVSAWKVVQRGNKEEIL